MHPLELIERARKALGREQGSIVPTVIGVLALTLLIGGVGMQQAGSANNSANRDRGVKRAIAAAESGLDVAVYRTKKVKPTATQCANPAGASPATTAYVETLSGRQWCAWSPVESLGSKATFQYRVSAPRTDADGKTRRRIVSIGTADGKTRRVSADIVSSGTPLFEGWAVSADGTFGANTAQITGNIRVDGVGNLFSSTVCGNIQHATTFSGSPSCGGTKTSGSFTLAPVVIPADANADNGRLCTANQDACTGGASFDANRRLYLPAGATVTLTGSNYRLCTIYAEANSRLIIAPRAAGTAVKIHIDAPGSCTGVSATDQQGAIILLDGARIENSNSLATSLQIYAVGSTTSTKKVDLRGTTATTVPVSIYAPLSAVSLYGATYRGSVAGKTVSVYTSNLTYGSEVAEITTGTAGFAKEGGSFRECTSLAGASESSDIRC